MSAASDFTEVNVLNALLRGQTFAQATTIYVALHTADPGETGGNEANYPSYSRRDAANGETADQGWTPPVSGNAYCQNAKQLIWPPNDSGASVTITHFSLWDAETSGNMLAHAALDTPRQLQPTDVFVANPNKFTVSMD